MASKVRLVESKKVYSGVTVSLRRDKFVLDNRTIEKEIVEHQPSVGLVPIIGRDVILVTQYRRAAGKTLLEIPAGKIEKGETPELAALREMDEETGFTGKLTPLTGWFLAPGYDTEFMHVFVVTDLKKVKSKGMLDEDENINVKRVRLQTAISKCFNGEIQDCKTVAALLAYLRAYNHSD